MENEIETAQLTRVNLRELQARMPNFGDRLLHFHESYCEYFCLLIVRALFMATDEIRIDYAT